MSNSDIASGSRIQPPIRPAMPAADTMASRHATTLAEIQQMTDDYRRMQLQVADQQRSLDAKDNEISLLRNALTESHASERIYQRKLIRLAAAMEMIGKLSADAEAIMRDARELDEAAVDAVVKGEG